MLDKVNFLIFEFGLGFIFKLGVLFFIVNVLMLIFLKLINLFCKLYNIQSFSLFQLIYISVTELFLPFILAISQSSIFFNIIYIFFNVFIEINFSIVFFQFHIH